MKVAKYGTSLVTNSPVGGPLRKRLTVTVSDGVMEGRVGEAGYETVFNVVDSHIDLEERVSDKEFVYPRGLFTPEELEENGFKVEYSPHRTPPPNPVMKRGARGIKLREGTQEKAFDACFGRSGHLILAPGKGKTVMALKLAGTSGKPFVVFVHNGNIFAQWEERVKEHLGDVRIGSARGAFKKWDWKNRDVVIATFQSFESVLKKHLITPVPGFQDFVENFDYVVFDEAHHVKARTFSVATRLFPGKRLALTATPLQLGYEWMAYAHVGPVLFQDTVSDLTPEVYFHKVQLPKNHPAHSIKPGGIALTTLCTAVLGSETKGMSAEYLDFIGEKLIERMSVGRLVMMVSPRVNPGYYLQTYFLPELGLLHGGVSNNLRDGILQSSPAVYATDQIGREALDRKELDTLFLLLPYSDGQLAENNFNQACGRVLRALPGKPQPEVHVFYPSGEVGLAYAQKTHNLARKLGYLCHFEELADDTYHKIRRLKAGRSKQEVAAEPVEPVVEPTPEPEQPSGRLAALRRLRSRL